jgi:monoamine oxidase
MTKPVAKLTAISRVSRRQLLAGGAVLGLLAQRRAAFAADVDVAIVGAGAAGIGAARELKKLGKTFVLLEARQRAGGRLHTDTSLGVAFEAGAAFIHFSDRNPWTPIAEEFQLSARPGSWAGWSRAFRDGKPLSDEQQAALGAAWSEVSTLVDDMDVEDRDLSFSQALAKASEAARTIGLQRAQMAMGEEPSKLSVQEWQELWSGSNLIVPEGYGTLAEKAAQPLAPRLGVTVQSVRWDGAGVELATSAGTIRAKTAIITVSTGVLRSGAIAFTPKLPAAIERAIDGLPMGALTKIALKVEGDRFGLAANSGFSDLSGGAAMTVQAFTNDKPLIVAHLGGDPARRLTEAGEAAAIAHVTERLAAIFGEDFRKRVTGGRLAGWWSDPYARGSYSHALPGKYGMRDVLARPVGERLWFAGEATAGPASTTAGGATLAGAKAAREAAAKIKV